MQYRRDIEGLRGLAVAPVVLYHAGASWFSGGYVGVDVFFVISGYLITRILAESASSGWRSIAQFYDRRVRRILPAYFVVVLATTAACLLIMPPDDLALYGRRLISTATFVSNFEFRAEMNYFAAASDLNPLLQTWSLSVEEQFYLLWPLALPLLITRVPAPFRALLVSGALLLSLGLAVYFVHFKSPVAGFYHSPARAWELLAGAVIALGLAGKAPSGRVGAALSLLGLACVLVPVVLYDNATPFPGLTAVIPVVGAATLLWTGEAQETPAARLLAVAPLRWIGLISYSLYLWHWPLLSLAKFWLSRDLTLGEGLGLAAVSVILAYLTWRFVETRFRQPPTAAERAPPRPAISLPIAAVSLAALAAIGATFVAADGLEGRSNTATRVAIAQRNDAAYDERCLAASRERTAVRADRCRIGPIDAPLRVALVGDSHGAQLGPALDVLGKQTGVGIVQWTKASCSPARDGFNRWDPARKRCDEYLDDVLVEIQRQPSIDLIILGADWSTPTEPAGQRALAAFVTHARASGARVALVGQTPLFSHGAGQCVVRSRFMGSPETRCWEHAPEQAARLVVADVPLRRISDADAQVDYIPLGSALCDKQWCRPTNGAGEVLMSDEQHLNYTGSLLLIPLLRPYVTALQHAPEPAAR